MTDRELTFGEKAVGLTFNPSGDEQVLKVKKLYAEIIDLVAYLPLNNGANDLRGRFIVRAVNDAIGAQMWAVKAITFQD